MAFFDNPGLVRVTNEGQKVFKDQYANKPYVIEPGETKVVPWEAAILWLGDPRVLDYPDKAIFDRQAELLRVLIRLGSHGLEEEPITDLERIERDRPRLSVTDIDNKPITMLAEDPEGDGVTPTSFVVGEKEHLLQELDRMKAEQSRILALLEQQANSQVSPGLDSIPDDTPNRVPGPQS